MKTSQERRKHYEKENDDVVACGRFGIGKRDDSIGHSGKAGMKTWG